MRRRIRRRFSVPCERPLRIEKSRNPSYELSVNAQDRRTPSLLREFIHPMERTGRVVTPTFDDWLKASAVMSAVGERDRAWRSKLPGLLNDILIALCARQIGALLFTYNRKDFR